MAGDLLEEIKQLRVDHHELVSIIQRHYQTSCSTLEDDIICPSNRPYALKIRYKDGVITKLEAGPGFSRSEFNSLKERAQSELADSPGNLVMRHVLFSCPPPVRGYFRSASSTIQILPAPPEAPRPHFTHADHPFILEFPVKRSTNTFVTQNRSLRGMLEWTWILNALLRSTITCIGPRMRNLWVLCSDDADGAPKHSHVKYAQEFYMIDGLIIQRDDFTTPSWSQISLIPHDRYYDRAYHPSQDELVLPESLSEMLDMIAGLAPDERRRFMRAVEWLYVARALWDHHISSYYIALISAIESLAYRSVPRRPCEKCGNDTSPGPTQRFQEFVERFGPRSEASESNKKWLYRLRSDIVHGRGLLYIDEAPWDFSFNTSWLQDRSAYAELSYLVRETLVNWLRAEPMERSMPHDKSKERCCAWNWMQRLFQWRPKPS